MTGTGRTRGPCGDHPVSASFVTLIGSVSQRDQWAGVNKVTITDRPAEADDRALPGHFEGDLIIGAMNRSTVGTLVERTTSFVMLLHLPDGREAEKVNDAMYTAISGPLSPKPCPTPSTWRAERTSGTGA